jgi:hypothetical protein
MPVSPICVVKNGGGPFVPTTNGVNVTPTNVISIRLSDTTDVTKWYLQLIGTDELTVPPVLANVNPTTYEVTTPSSVVTYTAENARGRALLFQSTVLGVGGPQVTTFTVYLPTVDGKRVGAAGETREGDAQFGWVKIINPFIRDPSSALPPGTAVGQALVWDGVGAYSARFITDTDIVGGYQTVANAAARDAIPTWKRSIGMSATTQDDGKSWKLGSDLTTWTEVGSGGGGGLLGGDVTGPSGTNIVSNIKGIPSPDPATKFDHDVIEIKDYAPVVDKLSLTYPANILQDGGYVYVAEYPNGGGHPTPVINPAYVWKLAVTGDRVTAVARADVTAFAGSNVAISEIQQDPSGPYIYASMASDQRIVIIEKATMTCVGCFGYSNPDFAIAYSTCSDGSYVYSIDVANNLLYKFLIAKGLGFSYHIPYTAADAITSVQGSGAVAYGAGKVWLATNKSNPGSSLVRRIDATTLMDDGLITDVLGFSWTVMYDYVTSTVFVVALNGSFPALYQINATTLKVIGYVNIGPDKAEFGPLIRGPGLDGTPNAAIWVASHDDGIVSAVNPSSMGLLGTFTLHSSYGYRGITAIGSMVYASSPKGEVTTYLPASTSISALHVQQPTPDWRLRYKPIQGGVVGPIHHNQVVNVAGVTVGHPAPEDVGKVPALSYLKVWAGMNATYYDDVVETIWLSHRTGWYSWDILLWAMDPWTSIPVSFYIVNTLGYNPNRGIRKIFGTPTHLILALDVNTMNDDPTIVVIDRASLVPSQTNGNRIHPVGWAASPTVQDMLVVGDLLYVTNSNGVYVFSITQILGVGPNDWAPPINTTPKTGPGQIRSAVGLAYDGTYLYVSDQWDYIVRQMDPTSLVEHSRYFPSDDPAGLLIAAGKLWVAVFSGIDMVNPSDMTGSPWTNPPFSPPSNGYSVAFDGTFIWLACGGSDSRLYMVNTSNTFFNWVSRDNDWYPSSPGILSVAGDRICVALDRQRGTAGVGGMAVYLGNNYNSYGYRFFSESGVWSYVYQTVGGFTAAGDLSGSSSSQRVVGIQGYPFTSGPAYQGSVPWWSGSGMVWGQPGGDVTGPINNTTVGRLQGWRVSAAAPMLGNTLIWNGWAWAPGAAGDPSGVFNPEGAGIRLTTQYSPAGWATGPLTSYSGGTNGVYGPDVGWANSATDRWTIVDFDGFMDRGFTLLVQTTASSKAGLWFVTDRAAGGWLYNTNQNYPGSSIVKFDLSTPTGIYSWDRIANLSFGSNGNSMAVVGSSATARIRRVYTTGTTSTDYGEVTLPGVVADGYMSEIVVVYQYNVAYVFTGGSLWKITGLNNGPGGATATEIDTGWYTGILVTQMVQVGGFIYAADSNNQVIHKITIAGEGWADAIPTMGTPYSITYDGQYLWYGDDPTIPTFYRIRPDGTEETQVLASRLDTGGNTRLLFDGKTVYAFGSNNMWLLDPLFPGYTFYYSTSGATTAKIFGDGNGIGEIWGVSYNGIQRWPTTREDIYANRLNVSGSLAVKGAVLGAGSTALRPTLLEDVGAGYTQLNNRSRVGVFANESGVPWFGPGPTYFQLPRRPVDGFEILIKDVYGRAATNPITIVTAPLTGAYTGDLVSGPIAPAGALQANPALPNMGFQELGIAPGDVVVCSGPISAIYRLAGPIGTGTTPLSDHGVAVGTTGVTFHISEALERWNSGTISKDEKDVINTNFGYRRYWYLQGYGWQLIDAR